MMGSEGLRWFLRWSGILIGLPPKLILYESAGVGGTEGEPPGTGLSPGGVPNGLRLLNTEVLMPTERSTGSDSLRTRLTVDAEAEAGWERADGATSVTVRGLDEVPLALSGELGSADGAVADEAGSSGESDGVCGVAVSGEPDATAPGRGEETEVGDDGREFSPAGALSALAAEGVALSSVFLLAASAFLA